MYIHSAAEPGHQFLLAAGPTLLKWFAVQLLRDAQGIISACVSSCSHPPPPPSCGLSLLVCSDSDCFAECLGLLLQSGQGPQWKCLQP